MAIIDIVINTLIGRQIMPVCIVRHGTMLLLIITANRFLFFFFSNVLLLRELFGPSSRDENKIGWLNKNQQQLYMHDISSLLQQFCTLTSLTS